jgi:hypothetical protein
VDERGHIVVGTLRTTAAWLTITQPSAVCLRWLLDFTLPSLDFVLGVCNKCIFVNSPDQLCSAHFLVAAAFLYNIGLVRVRTQLLLFVDKNGDQRIRRRSCRYFKIVAVLCVS